MRLASAATLLAVAALVAPLTTRLSGYAVGAPAGFSGGFGEPSCHACHFSAEPNSGPGRLTISGVPEHFAPGRQYPITIALTSPAMKLAGFQMTARFEAGGAQAGSLTPGQGEQERVGVADQGGIQYVSQRKAGTSPTPDKSVKWNVIWTAPTAADRAVIFHVAANAANGDETAEGDHVHTLAVKSGPGSPPSR